MYISPSTTLNPLGTITGFAIPGLTSPTGWTQDYLNSYDSGKYDNVGSHLPYPYTGNTILSYRGLGSSKLSELKKYGSTGYTQDLVFSAKTENNTTIYYTGYTFTYTINSATTTLQYFDLSDGTTVISGSTTGFTKEEVINYMLTRNEHFLGFVEQPQVYSDVFVNRGKQGVMERNFKLGEIENTGELDIYGNGYFKVKKQ